ncbi:hypothetical protein AB0M95_08095 [Sphaerisporangium sp. NPDC051017]|uniref:hypothetical protein n=1 Tax=Sphaerisporangium sp. NPDC051017 TaxID=3154636 RepID=UPI0034433E72
MGVIEVDRARARGPRLIASRPWADTVLDDAVDALGRGYLEPAIPALVATRGEPEVRALRAEGQARGHLARTYGRFGTTPWSYLGDPGREYHEACSRLNVITNG